MPARVRATTQHTGGKLHHGSSLALNSGGSLSGREPGNQPRRSALYRVAPRALASLLIAAGFAWALQRGGLPFTPPSEAYAHLRWWGIPAFVVLTAVSVYLRTARWMYLLRPLCHDLVHWRVFGIGLVGFSAVFFAPLRLGEMVRPYLIARDGEVTFVQAVGTVAAERIIDGLVLVLLTAAAFGLSTPLSPLPNRVGALPIPVSLVPSTLLFATVLFTLAFLTMAAFYVAREPARRLVKSVVGLVSERLADFCSGLVERLAQGFAFLPSWKVSGPFMRDTLLYWCVGATAQWALLWGVGLDPTPAQAFVALGVIGLGSLLPAGPGFFGAYQVATYTALAMFFPEQEVLTKGALLVFARYSAHVTLSALASGLGFLLIARFPSNATTERLRPSLSSADA